MVEISEVKDEAQRKTKKYVSYRDIHREDEEKSVGVGELYQLCALAFGAICYLWKFKWAAWATLYFFYCSIINFGHADMMQQGATSFGLVSIVFVQAYIAPDPKEIERRRREAEILENPEKVLSSK